jgi:hypothetical protein
MQPSVFRSAVTAWRDAFAAISKMPVVVGTAFAMMLSIAATNHALMPGAFGFGSMLVGVLDDAAQALLLTPAAIAVHRFIVLGERVGAYRIEPANPRFRRFFLFAFIVGTMLSASIAVMAVIGLFSPIAAGFAGYILFVVVAVLTLRTLILFPAIAVDARGAEWINAIGDSKGHTWRIFFTVVLVSIPLTAMNLLAPMWLGGAAKQTALSLAISLLIQAASHVLGVIAYAALASRLFIALANRLARANDPAGALPET